MLSSLCFGSALGEVFTVFGGLDCTVDVGTLTVLCIPHSFYYSYVPCRSFMLTESSLSLSVIIGSHCELKYKRLFIFVYSLVMGQ